MTAGKQRLVLGMTRAPAGVAARSREIASGLFEIGRAPDKDWVLPDPDRTLSKRHCTLEARDDHWFVTDTSSNGVSFNGMLLEPSVPHILRDGDQLAFGPYEFEARIGEHPAWAADDAPQSEARPAQDFGADRLTSDPFSLTDGDALEAAGPDVGLPNDFDPLVAGSSHPTYASAASDHTPDLNQNFRPPRPSFEVLPDDWDAETAYPEIAPPVPPPGVQLPAAAQRLGPAGPHAVTEGFASFAAGAGLPGASVSDPDAALRALGAGFRALVSGLRRTLMARATIKGEFRIDQTMIRARGNNPLKFSTDDDDALAALLGTGRQAGMAPDQAISEALRDMRLHELAVASAMQRAVRDVLSELDPAPVLQGAEGSFLRRLLGGRKRRAWDRHCANYSRLITELSDNFDSAYGKSFVRAYEVAMAEIASQDQKELP